MSQKNLLSQKELRPQTRKATTLSRKAAAMLAAVRRNVNPFQFLFGRQQADLRSVEEQFDPSQVLTTCKVWGPIQR